jgi:hypothetical protein
MMSNFLSNHGDALVALLLPVVAGFLPPVNQFLARLTGNKYVEKGMKVAKALEDGLQIEDVKALLDRR